MKTKFLEKERPYDGTQLRSLYNYLKHGLLGDSIVGWIGPCDIDPKNMVDGEDLRAKAEIRGSSMIHFIIELFDLNLAGTVGIQRLFASLAMDLIKETSIKREVALGLRRSGDDIYSGKKKLSISIATVSPSSCLIHFALNVNNEGTPVETLSLQDLAVDPRAFGQELINRFAAEMQGIREAAQKVRWVR